MATFPNFQPEYNFNKTIETKAVVVNLGDGFQQRTLFGLPQNQSFATYDFVFNVSKADGITILDFINDRDLDQASFDFTPPDEITSLKFICVGKRKTVPYLNRAKIFLKFRQVFEP